MPPIKGVFGIIYLFLFQKLFFFLLETYFHRKGTEEIFFETGFWKQFFKNNIIKYVSLIKKTKDQDRTKNKKKAKQPVSVWPKSGSPQICQAQACLFSQSAQSRPGFFIAFLGFLSLILAN